RCRYILNFQGVLQLMLTKKIVRTKVDNISRTAIRERKPGGHFGDFRAFFIRARSLECVP
ncbi:MAG: hypothetical protein ACI304_07775, partial [Lepagella sp.]